MINYKAPDQSIYDEIFRICREFGWEVYTHNPPPNVPYPFIKMGGVQVVPDPTKSYLMGHAYVMVDVWGDAKDRQLVSEIAHKIMHKLGETRQTSDGYGLDLSPRQSSVTVMSDNSTDDDLWRAQVSLQFEIY